MNSNPDFAQYILYTEVTSDLQDQTDTFIVQD